MKKIEPWNSVRVTFTIAKDAAGKLKQLAQQNSDQLKRLGILSVQVEGEDIIKLSISSAGNVHHLVVRSRASNQPGTSYTPVEHSNGNPHLNSIFDQLANRQEAAGPSGIVSQNNNAFAVPPQPQPSRKKTKSKEKTFDDKQNHVMNGPLMGPFGSGGSLTTPTIPELEEIIDPSELENLASLAVGKSGFDPSSRSVEEMVTDMIKHEEHLKQQKTNVASSNNPQSHFGNAVYNASSSASTLASNSPSQSSHMLGKADGEVDAQDLLNIPLQHFLTGGTEYQPSLSVSHSPLNTQHQMPYTSSGPAGMQTYPSTKTNSPHKHPMRQQSYPKGITEMPQGQNPAMAVHNVNRQMIPPGISPHSPMLQNFPPGNGRHSAGPSPQHHAMPHTNMDRRVNPAEYNPQQQPFGMYNHYQGHENTHGMSPHAFPHKNMDPQIRIHQMNPAWGNKIPPNNMQRQFDPRQQQPYSNNNMFNEKSETSTTMNSKSASGAPPAAFLTPSGQQNKDNVVTAEKPPQGGVSNASPLLVNLLQTETSSATSSSLSQPAKTKRKKTPKRKKSKSSAPSTPTTPTTLSGTNNSLANAGQMYQRYHNPNMYNPQHHNPHASTGQYFNNNNLHMQQNPAPYGNTDIHKNMYNNFQNGNNFSPKPQQMFHADHSRPAYIETINRSDVGLRTSGTNTMHMKQQPHDPTTPSDPTCVRPQSANVTHDIPQIHGAPGTQVNGLPSSPHHSVRNMAELSMQQSQQSYMFHGQKSAENLPVPGSMHPMNMPMHHMQQQGSHMPHTGTNDSQMFREGMMVAGQEEGPPNVVINGSDGLQKAMQIAKNSRQNVTANIMQRPIDNRVFEHNFHGGNMMGNTPGFHSAQKVPNYQQAGLAGPTNFNSSNNNFNQQMMEPNPDNFIGNERVPMFPTLPESSANSGANVSHFQTKSRKSLTTESDEMSVTLKESNPTFNESNLNPPGTKRAKMSPPDTLPTLPVSESSKPRKSPVCSSLSSPCVGSALSPASQKSANNSRSNPSTPHHFVSPMGSPMSQSNAGSRSSTPKLSSRTSTPRTKTPVRRTSSDQQRSPKTVTGTFTHVNGPQMSDNASSNVSITHQSSSSVPSSPCAAQETSSRSHHEQYHSQGSPQWTDKPNHISEDRLSSQRQFITSSHNLISPVAAKEQQNLHIYPQQENFFNSTVPESNNLIPNAAKTLVGKQENKAAQSVQLHS